MNFRFKKRCPRCNTKTEVVTAICPTCQLNFQKFEMATNKEAKIAMENGDSEQVLLRKGYPSDIKKWKLILLTIFLGFTGAHYYYVGRKKIGFVFTIFFLVGIANAVITTILQATPKGELWQVFTMLVLAWGAVLFVWILDIARVCFNRFKIPVSIIKN